MPNIFIFANSFTAKTIVLSVNNMLNMYVDEVLLLSENHAEYEFRILQKDITIRLFDNIDQAIDACDIVLICITPNMPLEKINRVKTVAKRMKKVLFAIENERKSDLKNDILTNISFDSSECIVILNIAQSLEAQQFNVEILLNRILSKHNILFKQFFSHATKHLLDQLNQIHMLNHNLAHQLYTKDEHFDIAVLSITFDELQESLMNFNGLRPDYVILQTNYKGDSIDEITALLKQYCNVVSDIIIKSHYIQLENLNSYLIYCNQKIELTENTYDLESNDLPSLLEFDIFSKIALPDGIRRL